MNILKKALAIIGLAAITVFVVSVVALLLTGGLAAHSDVTFGSMGLFLVCGGAAIVIQKLQDRAEREAAKEAAAQAAQKTAAGEEQA